MVGAQGLFSYAVHTANGQSNSIINNINNNKNNTHNISGAKSAYITTNAATTGTAIDTLSRDNVVPYVGVDIQGYYTSIPQTRNFTIPYFPSNYYEDSFRLISQSGMNHIRYVFYWESYIRNPDQFIDELNTVAKTADKYNIHVVYANHQFHTSSWLDPKNGVGFPSLLFKNDSNNNHSLSLYPYGSGGSPKSKVAQIWWSNWLDRNIKDANGDDGWALQADFLKKVVNTVERHPSTLGYEVLGESQVHKIDEWLEDMHVWGMAYWRLKFEPDKIPTYNLINVTHPNAITTTNTNSTKRISGFTSDSVATIQPTKYFEILKNTYPERYKK